MEVRDNFKVMLVEVGFRKPSHVYILDIRGKKILEERHCNGTFTEQENTINRLIREYNPDTVIKNDVNHILTLDR